MVTNISASPSSKRTTTEQGNTFRDEVCSLLSTAGFNEVKAEIRADFKKADASTIWSSDSILGTLRFLIEAKSYSGTLPKEECALFVTEYLALLENGHADHAWLISKGPISPDGRALIEARQKAGLKCFTFAELQRHLFRVDGYLTDLIGQYDHAAIQEYFVPPKTDDDRDLERQVREWVVQPGAPPLAILGGYGQGKSTFALHLAAAFARDCLKEPTTRVPILVPLGEIVDDQAIDGLLGKVLASEHRVGNYHFHLFRRLNEVGRLLLIFDGLDEMKHGMTLPVFEQNISKLLDLDVGEARILVLGRDTVFRDDIEFQTIIQGRQTTAAGRSVIARGRREIKHVIIRGFTLPEARHFIARYFPIKVQEAARQIGRAIDTRWVEGRITELLSGPFDELIVRPVHAQMLAEIATDDAASLNNISRFELYDSFIHYLIDREVRKPGRYPGFNIHIRRTFNAAVGWWLWEHATASTTTLSDIPEQICRQAVGDTGHHFDEVGLKRELTTGCLVEKGGQTIYFGHRSLQEFLVAEHLYKTRLLERPDARRPEIARIWPTVNYVVADFLLNWISRDAGATLELARFYVSQLPVSNVRDLNPGSVYLFSRLLRLASFSDAEIANQPWFILLGYFGGTATFLPVHRESQTFLARMTDAVRPDNVRAVATILCLLALDMKRPATDGAQPSEAVKNLLQLCLRYEPLAGAIAQAQRGQRAFVSIQQATEPGLWGFLVSYEITLDDGLVLRIGYDKMFRMMADLTGLPLAVFQSETEVGKGQQAIEVPLQTLYRQLQEMGVRGRRFDTIRPFFTDENLRRRIRPLIIERRPARSLR
jgi:hypothetical protein